MKYILSISLMLVIISILIAIIKEDEASSGVEAYLWEQEILLEDFDEMTANILSHHSFLFVDREDFEESIIKARAEIDSDMSIEAFYRTIKKLLASLNCGHSRSFMSEDMRNYRASQGSFLPLQVSIIDQEAIIEVSFGFNSDLIGLQILRINGQSIQEIIEDIYPLISTDGGRVDSKNYMISQWFAECYYEAYGDTDTYELEVLDNDGLSYTISIEGVAESELEAARQSLYGTPAFSLNIEEDIGVIVLPGFDYYQDEAYETYKRDIDAFFSLLYNQDVKTLAIDIRQNWGGDPRASAYLLQYLTDESFIYFSDEYGGAYYPQLNTYLEPHTNSFKGDIYLFTDGSGFSTAGHFSALFKHHNMGTIIGERTAGGYACSDGSVTYELNNTEIRYRLSQTIYAVATDDMEVGAGVEPDIYNYELPVDILSFMISVNY